MMRRLRQPEAWQLDLGSTPEERARRLGRMGLQSGKDLIADRGPQWAAAISYYALLSSVPLLLAAVSIASFFISPADAASRLVNALGEFAPQSGRIEETLSGVISSRGTAGLVSLVSLVWTGTRVFGSLTQALNIVYDIDEPYGFLKRLLIELVMLVTLGVAVVVALASGFLLEFIWTALPLLPEPPNLLFTIVQSIVRALFILVVYFLIYHYVPRGNRDHRASLFGALTATILFLIARPLFLFYIERFGSYNEIYGPIGIVIIALVWVWIVSLITLFGGEIASHTKAMLIDGLSAKEVERRHADRTPK